MVFFCCDGCGETLKKSQVDAHAYRCGSCASVSCVDCNVSFWGDDYRKHTSCLTEAERYEKTVYRGPKKGSDGEDTSERNHKKRKRNPQEIWNDLIAAAASAATDVDPALRRTLEDLTRLDNVPRKEKQFRNFTANSLRLTPRDDRTDLVGRTWRYLAEVRELERKRETTTTKSHQAAETEPSTTSLPPPPQQPPSLLKKEEKTTAESSKDVSHDDYENIVDSRKLVRTMRRILKKAPERRLRLKELRGKVKTKMNVAKSTKKKLKRMMVKQIQHCDRMKIDGKVVSLITVS